MLIEVKRYQCEFCKKDFHTPNRHYCKKNPELKNCFTCKHSMGCENGNIDYETGCSDSPTIKCECEGLTDELDLSEIKNINYNMQCSAWEYGEYDFSKTEEQIKW